MFASGPVRQNGRRDVAPQKFAIADLRLDCSKAPSGGGLPFVTATTPDGTVVTACPACHPPILTSAGAHLAQKANGPIGFACQEDIHRRRCRAGRSGRGDGEVAPTDEPMLWVTEDCWISHDEHLRTVSVRAIALPYERAAGDEPLANVGDWTGANACGPPALRVRV